MVDHLLATKLFLPMARPDAVQRPALLALLQEALRPGMRLALISAPAGFGKSHLLAEWLRHSGLPCAWISLDAGDNTPSVFLAYLLAAIERALTGKALETSALLRAAPGQDPITTRAVLASLINELAALPEDRLLLLALDDFQFVTNAEVRDAIAFFLENLPPALRLAIASRSDPPFPLARLRASNQMVEVRAADLQFTSAEAAAMLYQTMRLSNPLPETLVETLTQRTEGWAAGLQMAALALRISPAVEAEALVQTFSGSHRFVLDYLAEEVLSRLPPDTQTFLLETSILNRFHAELCAAVAREAFTGPTPLPAQALLEELEHANLFLIPMDTERTWFRFHHLFADLLRVRLRSSPPASLAALHSRAAAWFEDAGLPAEAIHHALLAGEAGSQPEYERAVRLVEQHTIAMMRRGALQDVLLWMQILPQARRAERPWLCAAQAWAFAFRGRLAEAKDMVQQAHLLREILPADGRSELEGHCAAILCHVAMLTGALEDVRGYASQVEEYIADPTQWARTITTWTVGFTARLQGDLERAAVCFRFVLETGIGQQDPWGTAMGATDLGIVRRSQGRLREAVRVFEEALKMLRETKARSNGYTSRLLTAYAQVLYEQNELGRAQALLVEALALTDPWPNPNHQVFARLGLTRLCIAQGEFSTAEEHIRAAEALGREFPLVQSLTASVQIARANWDMAQGTTRSDSPVLAAVLSKIETSPGPEGEPAMVLWSFAIRALLVNGEFSRALALANKAAASTQSSGQILPYIEFATDQALAWYSLGESGQALAAFERAVALAEPESILRPFLEAARLPGLEASTRGLIDGLSRHYPAYLPFAARLQVSPATSVRAETGHTSAQANERQPVEPLTEREREVLRLLAEGYSNGQIAQRLFISLGTVKAHTANIFRKLDASNRTHAVALARAWKLV